MKLVIEKLLLTDFQKHRRLVVEFDPLCTCFTGDTEAGKSAAAFRALLWVMLNQPVGGAMVGRWGKAPFAQAKLYVDDHCVRRKRGEGLNVYQLDDGTVLKAFGQGVPQKIADLVNVDEVNFQGQFDPPFWFHLPPAEVSRRLNSIVNLGEIDRVLANASKNVRSTKAVVSVTAQRLKAARHKKAETAWAVEFEARVSELEELDADISSVRTERSELATLAEGIAQAAQAAEDATRRGLAAQDAVRLGRESRQILTELQKLVIWKAEYMVWAEAAQAPVPDLTDLARLRDEQAAVRDELRRLGMFHLWVLQAKDEIAQYDQEIEECLKELKQSGKVVCPTCGQPVSSAWLSQTCTSQTAHLSPGRSHGASGTKSSGSTVDPFESYLSSTGAARSSVQETFSTSQTRRRPSSTS